MEILLLFFLFLAQNDRNAKDTVESFLHFYKENRDLIAMLTNAGSDRPAPAPSPSEEDKKTDPPENGADPASILEAFLKRNAV